MSPLRFSFANGQEDVSTSVFAFTVFALEIHILHSCAERARTGAVWSRCARRFGTCCRSRRLLRVSETVERLPSRHLALSLCTEDVKAQCEALTPETRERLNNVLSQKKVNPDTHVSLAHAHGYLKISRNHLLRVYRDVPVKDETTVEPSTSCDQATDEHHVIAGTRKRRRLTHKSPVSARFVDDFEEEDAIANCCWDDWRYWF